MYLRLRHLLGWCKASGVAGVADFLLVWEDFVSFQAGVLVCTGELWCVMSSGSTSSVRFRTRPVGTKVCTSVEPLTVTESPFGCCQWWAVIRAYPTFSPFFQDQALLLYMQFTASLSTPGVLCKVVQREWYWPWTRSFFRHHTWVH